MLRDGKMARKKKEGRRRKKQGPTRSWELEVMIPPNFGIGKQTYGINNLI